MPTSKGKARFIEPMLLVRTENLPEGDNWLYELLNGFPAVTLKTGGKIQLRFPQRQMISAHLPRHREGTRGAGDRS